MPTETTPKFNNPPVTEVVCGVQFAELEKLLTAHVGAFWDLLRQDYPDCEERAPLPPIIEIFEPRATQSIKFTNKPPLPRTWFRAGDGRGIIQIQRDRFHRNWRKNGPDDIEKYPGFGTVSMLFRESLEKFNAFLKDLELGEIKPTQYELTYVNPLLVDSGWATLAETGNVFPYYIWRKNENRYLPTPETIDWKTSFPLPDKSGRLHATIQDSRMYDMPRSLTMKMML